MRIRTCILAFVLFVAAGCEKAADSNSGQLNPANTDEQTVLQTEVAPVAIPPRGIRFVSEGNAHIAGTFYEPTSANSPGVLLLHQWQSDKSSYADFAKRLQESGFAVLAIDGRGFGESVRTTDGKSIAPERTDGAVAAMKKDVENAFLLLADQVNVDASRIAIVGASYGSSLAIIYAAGEPKVKAVAMLSPGTNYFGNMPTEPAVKSYGERPLLLVAAEDDADSAEAVKKLKDTGGGNPESKVYPKGGHGTNIFGAKVGIEDLIEDFLKKSLKKAE